MATANFIIINAKSYYAISDTYECENDEGVMETFERDQWEWDEFIDNIRYNDIFPNPSVDWNRLMDASELCESDSNWEAFGNGKATLIETNVESVIVIRSGYYEGAVLDYEIKVTTCEGETFNLSVYDNVKDMIDDYLDALENNIKWEGDVCHWNVGTFKIQKKNIRKWIEKRIESEIDKCEKFCKANADMELCISARFSNGETWYRKVG